MSALKGFRYILGTLKRTICSTIDSPLFHFQALLNPLQSCFNYLIFIPQHNEYELVPLITSASAEDVSNYGGCNDTQSLSSEHHTRLTYVSVPFSFTPGMERRSDSQLAGFTDALNESVQSDLSYYTPGSSVDASCRVGRLYGEEDTRERGF